MIMMTINNICIRRRHSGADVRSPHGVAHIICTTLLLIVITSHHHVVVAEEYTPAATPTSSIDITATYSPTTLSHANNVALHSLQGMVRGLRKLEDANDDAVDEYTNEEYQEQYYNNNGDEYDETDDGQDETDDAAEEEEEEGDDAVEEYQDDGQGDDVEESNSEDSEDSSEQSQDYNDDENNMMNNQDYWYADDPSMPTDDALLQQLQTEWEAEQIAAMLEAEERRVAMYNRIREVSMTVLSISMSILGFLSTVFCTTILLYFMRVQSLMRRYNNEGIKVVGRILVSEPDIESSMMWSNGGVVDDGPASISPIDDKLQTHDSYSMMTDDGSYIQVGMSSSSESNGSAAPQDHNGKLSTKEDVESEIRVVQQHKSDFNMQVLKEDEQHRHHSPIVSSVVSIAGGSMGQTKSSVKTRHINNNQTISQRKEHFNSETFRILVEYDDVTYHDEINQDSSDVIRKRLSIKGEDIEERKKSTNNNSKQQFRVKLLVLKDEPNSGYSSGDISRALRWQKWLSFFIHVMVGCAIILAGVYTTKNIVPTAVYYIYIGFLLLQIPIMNCFLQKSFTKIISKEYLEDGLSMSSKASMKGGIDEEKMMSTLNSSSFGLV